MSSTEPAVRVWDAGTLPVEGDRGGSQLVLHKHRNVHEEAAGLEARGEEGAVLGVAAFVHAELLAVSRFAARGQEDVHQRGLFILRVSPVCKMSMGAMEEGPESSPPHRAWSCSYCPDGEERAFNALRFMLPCAARSMLCGLSPVPLELPCPIRRQLGGR